MTTVDLKTREDYRESEFAEQFRVMDSIAKIDMQVKDVLKKGAAKSNAFVEFPRIKEIELLKKGMYSIDLEKTINDMFQVMKSMESQLSGVLSINSSLEKDLKDSKEIIANFNQQNSEIEAELAKMKDELPSKRELQIEIDYHIDERNKAELEIRELKAKIDKLKYGIERNQQKATTLEEQKADFISEINFLEARLNADSENSKQHQREISVLKGKILVGEEKIKSLQIELKDALDEKYRLMGELKASRSAVRELHAALNATKLQAKKTFYQTAESNRSDNRLEAAEKEA
ncbi:MAG: hypothetical protein HQK64_04335 [Desulfamplus sp.]|nr:hypothetical protein [Desulfamplus sp.]MBF0388563.1 hypothetical protein [Desulfamplus sp.]